MRYLGEKCSNELGTQAVYSIFCHALVPFITPQNISFDFQVSVKIISLSSSLKNCQLSS